MPPAALESLRIRVDPIQDWDFGFEICLEFGVWRLEFPFGLTQICPQNSLKTAAPFVIRKEIQPQKILFSINNNRLPAPSPMNPLTKSLSVLLSGAVAMSVVSTAQSGTFFADFNSGATPPSSALYGDAVIETSGGYTNSGCLKLTKATGSQQGSFIINDLDAGQPVLGFTVAFKALVGGG